MTVSEIRNLVRESEFKSWYNSITLQLRFPYADEGSEINLQGIDSVYQYFEKQHEFFENNKPLPSVLEPSKRYFNQSLINIESFVKDNLVRKRNNYKVDWANLEKQLKSVGNHQERYFNKESAATDFLLKLDSEYKGASRGAYDFLTNQNFQYNNSDKNYFIGWHRAYEFFTQDADLVKRRNNERNTLSRIRNEYLQNLEQNDKLVSDHIAEKEKQYVEKEESISRLIRKKNTQYETWKEESQTEFSGFLADSDEQFVQFISNSGQKVKDLEELYKEKLKLSAPAQYWKDRADTLRKEGNRWLYGLIICIVISILCLGYVLYAISNGKLKEFFLEIESAIKWSIIFITFVSFLAYAIRIFAKLTFSSYHLVRDAEEREQLAYVYLALKKEKNIDETERHLIMQSLFSRADSGLLKDDSSPTMPGGSVIEKIMGGK